MTYYEGGKNNFSQSEAIWGLQSGFGFGDGINLAYFLALEIATFLIPWDTALAIKEFFTQLNELNQKALYVQGHISKYKKSSNYKC